ncbi:MAG: HEPN domain-containing protein [Deltaproteobacteria bacterium]|nr:HEPN domain-containing protein [Deltaproteobacteria bacterium]
MKDETRTWLSFADENLAVARLTLEHGHLNACLQNAQQAVEKYLKAMIVELDIEFRRTHSIRELAGLLGSQDISVVLAEDEMDLMDAIYVPSKYPVYTALPYMEPETAICEEALEIAGKIRKRVWVTLQPGDFPPDP